MIRHTGWAVFLTAAGAALLALSFLIPGAQKAVQGVTLGLGVSLVCVGFTGLVARRWEKKHPAQARQSKIEMEDERNTFIRWRARASAAGILQWFVIGFAFVQILTGAALWITLCTVGIFVLYYLLCFFFLAKYQKEM